MGPHASLRWKRLFPTWCAPFLSSFRHRAQRCWAPVSIQGLCSTVHRKSIVPLAERRAPGKVDQLQQFITDSLWEMAPLLRVLAQQANTLLGGTQAVLIIDNTCLAKFGTHSVGVARQYSSQVQVGTVTNCQCLLSLTLAKDDLPIPLALRFCLPSEWAQDWGSTCGYGAPDQMGTGTGGAGSDPEKRRVRRGAGRRRVWQHC
jgi:SRSO17 transposase